MKKKPALPTPFSGNLPTESEIKAIARKQITRADLMPPDQGAPRLTDAGRARFTTMLRPDLREKLQAIAGNNRLSIADVLEMAVEKFLTTLP